MKMLVLILTLYAFAAVIWERVSPQNVVEEAGKTTMIVDDGYEAGAYAAPMDVTKSAMLKGDSYEDGAYEAPAILKVSTLARPTD